MARHEFVARVAEEEGGPEPSLRERFAVIIGDRVNQLEQQKGIHPKAGDHYEFVNAFEGPCVREMTDARFDATPPTLEEFEVLTVGPAEPAAGHRHGDGAHPF